MTRRTLLLSTGALAARGAASPLKIGHRQANLFGKPGPEVFDLARRIPGLSGVELQVVFKGTTLWDRDTLMSYKRGAERTGLKVPSLAGVWGPGVTIMQPGPAEEHLRKAIQAAELIGAGVILVAFFQKNCPSMDQESSYGPVVDTFQKVAQMASGAGVALAMEDSLAPADDKKLVDLIHRPSVKIYYDLDNVESYGHTGKAVPGIELLGVSRIAQVHLKNESKLLEEPGRVDWRAAIQTLKKVGYKGWFVFESAHSGPEQAIEATQQNIACIERNFA